MHGLARSGWLRRAAGELALLVVIGAFLGAIGPYGTNEAPAVRRFPYWLICIVGGGLFGLTIDRLMRRVTPRAPLRVLATALAMTPLVTLLVLVTGWLLLRQPLTGQHHAEMLWNVFIIALPVMAVRELTWHRPAPVVETRTIVAAPLPEAEAAFRRRLSAPRRNARLIAVEAHDHYLRVHTDAGTELLTMRFADALAALSAAHGLQVHRSWWVAADAIETVRWRRGGGEASLVTGVIAPVSRTFAPDLRAAGWF